MQYEIKQSSRYETDAGVNSLMHEKDFSLPLRLITIDCARLIYRFIRQSTVSWSRQLFSRASKQDESFITIQCIWLTRKVTATGNVVSYAAVLCLVTQHSWSGAWRDKERLRRRLQETRRCLRWLHIRRSQRWTLLIVLSYLERYLPLPQGRLVLQIFLQYQWNPVYKSKCIDYFFSNLSQRHIIFNLLTYGLPWLDFHSLESKCKTPRKKKWV